MPKKSNEELANTQTHVTNTSVWVASFKEYWDVGDSRTAALAALSTLLALAGEHGSEDFTSFRCEEHVVKTAGWVGHGSSTLGANLAA